MFFHDESHACSITTAARAGHCWWLRAYDCRKWLLHYGANGATLRNANDTAPVPLKEA
jgi:hypothetical protein